MKKKPSLLGAGSSLVAWAARWRGAWPGGEPAQGAGCAASGLATANSAQLEAAVWLAAAAGAVGLLAALARLFFPS